MKKIQAILFIMTVLLLISCFDAERNNPNDPLAEVGGGSGGSSTVLRTTGPAGGLIFYDKGSYSNGWRYLEAAPESTEWTGKEWGTYGYIFSGTSTDIGTGQANTTAIVSWLNSNADDTWGDVTYKTDRAAYLCDSLSYGGYSDWFLPSKEELFLIYVNLKMYDVGGFSGISVYWSSSSYTINQFFSMAVNFFNGQRLDAGKQQTDYVRAIRAY